MPCPPSHRVDTWGTSQRAGESRGECVCRLLCIVGQGSLPCVWLCAIARFLFSLSLRALCEF